MQNKDKITIEFRIFANLRDILGFKIIEIDIKKGTTIKELLYIIRDKFAGGLEFLQNVIDPKNQKVLPYVKILIDGRILMGANISNTEIVNNRSVIAIFPPVGGG